LHDYIPGTVQKIAFDQKDNRKIAMVYRILRENGYLYRVRIYNLTGELDCESHGDDIDIDTFLNVGSSEDIEDRFASTINDEKFYLDESNHIITEAFEDFVLETHSRVTALNFYTNQGKQTLTFS